MGKKKKKQIKSEQDKEDIKQQTPIVFSFKFLEEGFIKKQRKNNEVFKEFVIRLNKLCQLGWNEIENSNRHSFGFEELPLKQFKPQMPSCITDDINSLYVFRADGANHVFAGFREDNTFFVVFVETEFGTLYNH